MIFKIFHTLAIRMYTYGIIATYVAKLASKYFEQQTCDC